MISSSETQKAHFPFLYRVYNNFGIIATACILTWLSTFYLHISVVVVSLAAIYYFCSVLIERGRNWHEIFKIIKKYDDFPKKGMTFYDIHPLLRAVDKRNDVLELYTRLYTDQVDVIVGLESRGYYFALMLADRLQVPFVPIRKAGKLPGEVISEYYVLEYGDDAIEIQKNVIQPGSRVLVVDDLLATGGTLRAACYLLKKVGAKIVRCEVQIELVDLKGREKLPDVHIAQLVRY